MPGVPFNHSCSTCKARRVKVRRSPCTFLANRVLLNQSDWDQCDKTRPTCLNCRKRGDACGGFQANYKFVDQASLWTGKSTERVKRRDSCIATTQVVKLAPLCHEQDDLYGETQVVPHSSPLQSRLAHGGIPSDLRKGFELLIRTPLAAYYFGRPNAAVFWTLDANTAGTSISRTIDHDATLTTYLTYIPSRLGHDQALDDAAASLLRAVAGLSDLGNARPLQECMLSYSCALRSLQVALNDGAQAVTSETLCAVMLLGVFDGFAEQVRQ